jgi:MFS transporter, DHA3 family, macrolide efflux protein
MNVSNGAARGPRRPSYWTRDFFLLWQGQLVSSLGDVAYSIALGFWILTETGSTAFMGTLMAVSTLPRILVGPFAGVWVDRRDRKWLMVIMDGIRGVLVVLVGVAAYAGFLHVWMVFAAWIIIGLCGAFFGPAANASIPDLVPKESLIQANSAFSLIQTGSGVVGNSAGGVLFQSLGAPFMFLFNGLSYLFSSLALVFTRIPRIIRPAQPKHFFADLKDGFALTWNVRGLRDLFIIAAVLNFFAVMGIVLFLPLFQRAPELGAARYGIAMAGFAGGLFVGFLLASVIAIRPALRFRILVGCGLTMCSLLTVMPLLHRFPLILAVMVVAGVANAVLNAFIGATIQLTVPRSMLGKVGALLNSFSGGLTPIAMALGGVLAELLPLRLVISGCFLATLVAFLPLFFSRPFREFVGFDPEKDSLETLMGGGSSPGRT